MLPRVHAFTLSLFGMARAYPFLSVSAETFKSPRRGSFVLRSLDGAGSLTPQCCVVFSRRDVISVLLAARTFVRLSVCFCFWCSFYSVHVFYNTAKRPTLLDRRLVITAACCWPCSLPAAFRFSDFSTNNVSGILRPTCEFFRSRGALF